MHVTYIYIYICIYLCILCVCNIYIYICRQTICYYFLINILNVFSEYDVESITSYRRIVATELFGPSETILVLQHYYKQYTNNKTQTK